MVREELTRREFGNYVSVYNFRDAIADGAGPTPAGRPRRCGETGSKFIRTCR
jgi:hypothetical protein